MNVDLLNLNVYCRRRPPAMGIGTQFPTITTTLSEERSPLIKESGHAVQKDRDKTDKLIFYSTILH